MEFTAKYKGYFQRIIRGLIVNILIALTLFFYFLYKAGQLNFIVIAIPFFVIIISFIRYEHWYRFYIIRIQINKDSVFIEIFDRNTKKEYLFNVDEIRVVLDKTFTYGSFYKLTFNLKGRKQFVQYQIGEWNKEMILELHEALKPPTGASIDNKH